MLWIQWWQPDRCRPLCQNKIFVKPQLPKKKSDYGGDDSEATAHDGGSDGWVLEHDSPERSDDRNPFQSWFKQYSAIEVRLQVVEFASSWSSIRKESH